MTEHDDGHELHQSPLSPADDARIRSLLADARHTEPIPQGVATRLDRVLADLSAERASRHAHHDSRVPVVDLAARRRRRTAANLLVAAAAVMVVGFGIGQVLPDGMTGADDAAPQEASGGGTALDSGSGASRNGDQESSPEGPAAGEVKAFRIRSERFGQDVRQVRVQVRSGGAQAFLDDGASGCLTVDVGEGEVVPATYDGAPAAIVLRAPSGDVQVVDLYLCGDAEPRRSITLTLP